MMNLTNQTVGDAISDMLLVETILKARDWSMSDWANCYTDLPNRLMKVAVKVMHAIDRKIDMQLILQFSSRYDFRTGL